MGMTPDASNAVVAVENGQSKESNGSVVENCVTKLQFSSFSLLFYCNFVPIVRFVYIGIECKAC